MADDEPINLIGKRVRGLWLANAHVTGAWLMNASIEGDFEGLVMNGVEVAPLIDAELRKRHPILAKNYSRSIASRLEALDDVYAVWDALITRATVMGDEALHTQVDGEWSFAETVRHLIYATDCWFRHGVLDDGDAIHAIAMSHSEEYGKVPAIDLDAKPSFDEVLRVRRENQAQLRTYMASLSDDDLNRPCTPSHPGHPSGTFPVGEALWVIVNEEFWHSTYAERDLNSLSAS